MGSEMCIRDSVDAVQHLITAELRDVHVARTRFTLITSSRSPASSSRFSKNWRTRASTTSGASRLSKRAESSEEFVVKVAWEGLEEAKITWEPASRVFHDVPAVLRKELKALRLKAEQKRALVQRYGLRL